MAAAPTTVFGLPLGRAVPPGASVPTVIEHCINLLSMANPVSDPTLFDLPVTSPEVQQIKDAFDAFVPDPAADSPASTASSPNVIASLLILYFKCLPHPIVPPKLYITFLRLAVVNPLRWRLAQYRVMVAKLPAVCRNILHLLLPYLHETELPADKLGAMFARYIMRPSNEHIPDASPSPASAVRLVTQLIEQAPYITLATDEPKLSPEELAVPLPTEGLKIEAKVLYDYTPPEGAEGMLVLKKDEHVKLLGAFPDDWLEGQIEDRTGFIPAAYVEVIPANLTRPVASATPVAAPSPVPAPANTTPVPAAANTPPAPQGPRPAGAATPAAAAPANTITAAQAAKPAVSPMPASSQIAPPPAAQIPAPAVASAAHTSIVWPPPPPSASAAASEPAPPPFIPPPAADVPPPPAATAAGSIAPIGNVMAGRAIPKIITPMPNSMMPPPGANSIAGAAAGAIPPPAIAPPSIPPPAGDVAPPPAVGAPASKPGPKPILPPPSINPTAPAAAAHSLPPIVAMPSVATSKPMTSVDSEDLKGESDYASKEPAAPVKSSKKKGDNCGNEFKIVVVGSGGVGKSAITISFVQNHFVEEYDPTIEDSYRKQITVDDIPCFLNILDTAGQEEYSAMRDQYMKTGQGFLLVFSLTTRSTFDEVSELRNRILQAKDRDQVPIVLVGNKSDLVKEHQVSLKEAADLGRTFACPFLATSAKLRINVEESFTELVREVRKDTKNVSSHKGGACSLL